LFPTIAEAIIARHKERGSMMKIFSKNKDTAVKETQEKLEAILKHLEKIKKLNSSIILATTAK
jgi:membrane-anchored protein YejM (alkaline phosphatase superfamily)